MRKNNLLKKTVGYLYRELILLFAPETLIPLHLASLYKSSITKDKKQLLKLTKKMLEVNSRLKEKNILSNQYNIIDNNVKLFYDVYNNKDSLTLNELKVLKKYCYVLKDSGNFTTIYYSEDKEKYNYEQYCKSINKLIDEKRLKKFFD